MSFLRAVLPWFLIAFWVPAAAGWDPRNAASPVPPSVRDAKVRGAILAFLRKDPEMQRFFDKAHGYAVFPTVGKAGMGLGGAFGKGRVYRQGRYIGDASLTQLTLGFQLGGQAYSEVIFFGDRAALERFTSGNFAFSAQASAVAATAGASADADYEGGVAVFTLAKGGLMYEASIGGQKFHFTPADDRKRLSRR